MAITPLFMSGAGFARGGAGQSTEFSNGYTTCLSCSAGGHTGAAAFSIHDAGASYRNEFTIPATRRFRIGLWLYHNHAVTDATVKSVLLEWKTAAGAAHIGWIGVDAVDAHKLAAYVGDHTAAVTETSTATFNHTQWYNVCLDVKVDNAAGWIYVWQDGVNIISFDGNTGNADVAQIVLGHCAAAGVSWQYGAVDDYYIDDITGEAAPSIPPDRRIYVLYAANDDVNRTYQEGLAKGGGASAAAQVDDGMSSDTDTTYNYVDALDERETYELDTFVQPSDSTIYAVQVKAHALKTDAGTDTEIALMQRGGAVATDYEDAASQNLAGDWLLYSGDIRLVDPSANPWAIAQIDSLEAGFRGKGTF